MQHKKAIKNDLSNNIFIMKNIFVFWQLPMHVTLHKQYKKRKGGKISPFFNHLFDLNLVSLKLPKSIKT